MCVADIEGKGFRADASDVAAGINTGFFVRFGKLGIDIDNITLCRKRKAAAVCTGCADTDFGFDKAASCYPWTYRRKSLCSGCK